MQTVLLIKHFKRMRNDGGIKMKELICVRDIENILKSEERKVYVTSKTILTPSAKDIIKNNNIEVILKNDTEQKKNEFNLNDIDVDELTHFFKLLIKENLYQEVLERLLTGEYYEQEKDATGFTLTKGESIRYKKIDKKNINILCQEVRTGTQIATFLEIENSVFDKKIFLNEKIYIIEGKIEIQISDRKYTGKSGDILFVPSTVEKIKVNIKENTKMLSISEKSVWKEETLSAGEIG